MTPQAYKFLLDRVRKVSFKSEPESAAVRAAHRLIDREYLKRQEINKRRSERLENQRLRVREIIHSGDYESSLKALKEFERMKF